MPAKSSGNRLFYLASAISAFVLLGTIFGLLPFDAFEVFGIVTGMACVVLAIRQNVWNFPLGMINNVCFAVLFYKTQLYGIMAVQVIYFILGAHGWYCWKHISGKGPLRISRLRAKEAIVMTLIAAPAVWILTGYLNGVDDVLPFPDAVTTVLSVSAQYLLNLKRAENWAIGIVADVIYTAIYISQGLYLTAGLYAFYLVMCVMGYREWLGIYREQKALSCIAEN